MTNPNWSDAVNARAKAKKRKGVKVEGMQRPIIRDINGNYPPTEWIIENHSHNSLHLHKD